MFLNFRILIESLPLFLRGTYYTCLISVVCIISAFVVSVFISGAMETRNKMIERVGNLYLSINRNTPGLFKLYFIYFGSPAIGFFPGPLLSGILAITLHNSGYMIEILRGGYLSIPKAQFEAAKALGMSHWTAVRFILFPQVFRNALPAIGNYWIDIVKQSSLASTVTVTEILYYAKSLSGEYMRPIEFLGFAGALYLILTLILSLVVRKWEASFKYPR
jgi:polar amino acid transport system permease protein